MTARHLLPESTFSDDSPGTGRLTSEKGNLPLVAMTVDADITALLAATSVRQTFRNPHDGPIEATYIFPLPDRAAVTDFSVTIGSRHLTGVLEERQVARDAYDLAMAAETRADVIQREVRPRQAA